MSLLNSYRFLVPIAVLMMFLPSTFPAHASPLYSAGVTVGQWASYSPVNVTYHGTFAYTPVPQQIKDLNATVQFTATVKRLYTSANVTVQSVTQYKNGTTQASISNGDLMSGLGDLNFSLIAGGLSSRDHLWVSTFPTPTINYTLPMTYLGVSRTVNILNITTTIPVSHGYGSANFNQEYVWDQASGIILEFKGLTVFPTGADGGYVEYTDVRIQSTNVFYNPYSPDFTVTASNPASVTSGTTATSTITVWAVKGFTGTVALTDATPSRLTCSPISPSTIKDHGTASLSCSSTTPGTYAVNIAATSGPARHSTNATITITSGPSQTPNAPILGLAPATFYAIIGAIILGIAATGTYLVLRTRREGHGRTTTSATAT